MTLHLLPTAADRAPHFPEMTQIAVQWAQLRPFGGASLIMADPPWHFEDWSPKGDKRKSVVHQYETQHLDWLKALPIDALAAPKCLLWLWATNPMMPQALDLMEAWGFAYSTMGHWNKRTPTGRLAFGGGRRLRSASEPFIIATRGNPLVQCRSIRSVLVEDDAAILPPDEIEIVIDALRREHSRKPEAAYDAAEAMSPDQPRVELFARQLRDGWNQWGRELEKFTEEKEE